jgi:lipid A 3-O-deacylase
MKKFTLLILFCLSSIFGCERLFAAQYGEAQSSQVDHSEVLSRGGGLFTLSGGVFDFMRKNHRHRTAQILLEYKPDIYFRVVRPFLGSMVTFRSSFYLYGGIALEFFFNKNFYIFPNFALGYYNRGNGKNLGFPLEFRTGIETGWQFNSFYRLGIIFFHISNAHLGSHNPGEESLAVTLSIPFGSKSVRKTKRNTF